MESFGKNGKSWIRKIILIVGCLCGLYLTFYINFQNGFGLATTFLRQNSYLENVITNSSIGQYFLSETDLSESLKCNRNGNASDSAKCSKDNGTVKNPGNKTKVILFWNDFFSASDWYIGFGHRPFAGCKHQNCITTNDHSQLQDSDAVLCHMRSPGCTKDQLPQKKDPKQYWIYFLVESQVNSISGSELIPYNGFFNMTITFLRESNISQTYSEKNNLLQLLKSGDHKFHRGKDVSLAWIASNCFSSNALQGRTQYFHHLSTHMKAVPYGRCPGHVKCGTNCYEDVAKVHKFYFAAENSLCKDYITEKPWKALEVGMIPVVYGGANYSGELPPGSYIDVRDFTSPRKLAEYLKRVGNDEKLYNSYFKWRETYLTVPPRVSYQCQLCEYLNQPNQPTGVLYNLDQFWSQSKDCINPHTFNEKLMQE